MSDLNSLLGQQMQGNYQATRQLSAEEMLHARLISLEGTLGRVEEMKAEAERIRKALAALKGDK